MPAHAGTVQHSPCMSVGDRLSEGVRASWADPEKRARRIAGQRGSWTPERRRLHGERIKQAKKPTDKARQEAAAREAARKRLDLRRSTRKQPSTTSPKKYQRTTRTCLSCKKPFSSTWAGNRRCKYCVSHELYEPTVHRVIT